MTNLYSDNHDQQIDEPAISAIDLAADLLPIMLYTSYVRNADCDTI